MAMEMDPLKTNFLLKKGNIFHCYVSLPDGNIFSNECLNHQPANCDIGRLQQKRTHQKEKSQDFKAQ